MLDVLGTMIGSLSAGILLCMFVYADELGL